MSKIGKRPIPVPDGVKVELKEETVYVKGPKGELQQKIDGGVKIEVQEKEVMVTRLSNSPQDRAFHGLYRSLINNMVVGTSEGFTRVLELSGTGYRAKVSGNQLELSVGYSHPVVMDVPEGINCAMEGQTKIILTSTDKQKVGQFAANIRKVRPPEPYKGKGIKYQGERIRRKAGKTGK
jgi:large subunit ribosomal protein L6